MERPREPQRIETARLDAEILRLKQQRACPRLEKIEKATGRFVCIETDPTETNLQKCSSQKQSRFYGVLPPEIRDMMFALVLTPALEFDPMVVQNLEFAKRGLGESPKYKDALLRTCRRIWLEYHHLLQKTPHCFWFDEWPDTRPPWTRHFVDDSDRYKDFVDSILKPRGMANLKRLHLFFVERWNDPAAAFLHIVNLSIRSPVPPMGSCLQDLTITIDATEYQECTHDAMRDQIEFYRSGWVLRCLQTLKDLLRSGHGIKISLRFVIKARDSQSLKITRDLVLLVHDGLPRVHFEIYQADCWDAKDVGAEANTGNQYPGLAPRLIDGNYTPSQQGGEEQYSVVTFEWLNEQAKSETLCVIPSHKSESKQSKWKRFSCFSTRKVSKITQRWALEQSLLRFEQNLSGT